MRLFRAVIATLARVALSATFLGSGWYKILYWKEAEKLFLNLLGDWQTHTVSSEGLQAFFGAAVVWAPVILMVATFVEILGALLLLFGIREKLGAFLLVVILVPATILMQHFWFVEGSERDVQIALFLRDIAILGGLLIVILHGAHGEIAGSQDEDSFSKMS